MVKMAVFWLVPTEAEIVAAVFEVTLTVFTLKLALVLPAGMVTEDGTPAEECLLNKE
jgi:hypothetical protein